MGSSEVNRELLNAGYSNAPMRERLSTIERKRVLLAKTVLAPAEFTELVNALSDERTFSVARKKLGEDFAEQC